MSIQILEKYFPNLTDLQKDQLTELGGLYSEWNQKINVISRRDIDELMERHILHSLSISLFYDLDNGLDVLDIGTGGGFPGIPLAIINPTSNFVLIDSIGKKIKVVNGVCKSLGLKNCVGLHENAKQHKSIYDIALSRAVTAFDPFLEYTTPLLKNNGKILCLKGGDLSQELKNVQKSVKLFSISDKIEGEFFETKKLVQYSK
jgi:16S rRNA (guanine527-N7)-methyltransferase|tara:strand:+ start:8100 stop:8708 length:609 start_codon:yes stop_codon:yes gene_type:complete